MKIGVITMHRIPNYGSVLQAYALQYKLAQLGFDSEYIDYVHPEPIPYNQIPFRVKMKRKLKKLIYFLLRQNHPSSQPLIENFRQTRIKCSPNSYSKDTIHSNPPVYDIYMTGSDQVWNPRFIGDETAFMFDFVKDKSPRISYAASFASQDIPPQMSPLYTKYLSKYKDITVREQAAVETVNHLTGKKAEVVCDPTLLLNKTEWTEFSHHAAQRITGNYILVYLLGYMFNPRPGIYKVVKEVRRKLNLPVYYLGGTLSEMLQPNSTYISGLTPEEYVKLFANASFVVTDSFHGTAFSTIFNIPMIGIVHDFNHGDGRLTTLRNIVKGERSIIAYNQIPKILQCGVQEYLCEPELLEKFRADSIAKLNSMVLNATNENRPK